MDDVVLPSDLKGLVLTGRGNRAPERDLSGRDLGGANLANATLAGVNLKSSVLTGAKLGGADFSQTILTGASLPKRLKGPSAVGRTDGRT